MKRSLLVQTLLDMATGSGGAKLEELIVDGAGTFDAGSGKGYNPVTVPSGTINVLGEKGVVSNNSVVVTPKAQVVGGWLNGGETSGTGVAVSASELVSGSETYTENGDYDVTNLQSVRVNVPTESWVAERTYTWDNDATYTDQSAPILFTPSIPPSCTKIRLTFEGSIVTVGGGAQLLIGMASNYGVNSPSIAMTFFGNLSQAIVLSLAQQITVVCFPNSQIQLANDPPTIYARIPYQHSNTTDTEYNTSPIRVMVKQSNGLTIKSGSTLKLEYTTI